MIKNPCSTRVFGGNSFRGHPCTRAGKVEREGKWYCTQHDPVRERAERDARQKAWAAEATANIAAWEAHRNEVERQRKLATEAPILRAALEEILTLCADGGSETVRWSAWEKLRRIDGVAKAAIGGGPCDT